MSTETDGLGLGAPWLVHCASGGAPEPESPPQRERSAWLAGLHTEGRHTGLGRSLGGPACRASPWWQLELVSGAPATTPTGPPALSALRKHTAHTEHLPPSGVWGIGRAGQRRPRDQPLVGTLSTGSLWPRADERSRGTKRLPETVPWSSSHTLRSSAPVTHQPPDRLCQTPTHPRAISSPATPCPHPNFPETETLFPGPTCPTSRHQPLRTPTLTLHCHRALSVTAQATQLQAWGTDHGPPFYELLNMRLSVGLRGGTMRLLPSHSSQGGQKTRN